MRSIPAIPPPSAIRSGKQYYETSALRNCYLGIIPLYAKSGCLRVSIGVCAIAVLTALELQHIHPADSFAHDSDLLQRFFVFHQFFPAAENRLIKGVIVASVIAGN